MGAKCEQCGTEVPAKVARGGDAVVLCRRCYRSMAPTAARETPPRSTFVTSLPEPRRLERSEPEQGLDSISGGAWAEARRPKRGG